MMFVGFNSLDPQIGSEYIGIGGDYDGVDSLPKGLEDVSEYVPTHDYSYN